MESNIGTKMESNAWKQIKALILKKPNLKIKLDYNIGNFIRIHFDSKNLNQNEIISFHILEYSAFKKRLFQKTILLY